MQYISDHFNVILGCTSAFWFGIKIVADIYVRKETARQLSHYHRKSTSLVLDDHYGIESIRYGTVSRDFFKQLAAGTLPHQQVRQPPTYFPED